MTIPTIASLPNAPSRQDSPTTFATDADALLGALPTMVSEYNSSIAQANIDLATANAAVAVAVAASSATPWVSGTTYALYAVVWSPTTFYVYRRKVAGSGTTDPALDSTNWTIVAGIGDVTQAGVQTLTNKTFTDPAIIGAIKEDVYTITDGASVDIDPGNGTIQTWTLGANRTPTATNFADGESVELRIADGTAFAVTWSSIPVVWVDTATPTLATSGYTIIELWKVGSTIYGARVGDVAS